MSDKLELENWRAKAVRSLSEVDTLRAQLTAAQQALQRFREDRERLLARIEFAAQPIGNCGHCLVGNKPGAHHLPDCPAYRKGDGRE